MSKYLHKYDYKQAKCNDSEIMNDWFKFVRATIVKYEIVTEDIYRILDESHAIAKLSHNKMINLKAAKINSYEVKSSKDYSVRGSKSNHSHRGDQCLCQMAMHGATLLSEENRCLRSENQRQKRKRDIRRSYIAQGGILAVGEGLQLAEERANNGEGSGVRSGTTKKTSAQRLCSQCKLPGHYIRTCPGIKNSINVIV